ncbi:MAG TPA: hypothetical protein VIJ26_12155 [Thermoanaerobaculia bacterium]
MDRKLLLLASLLMVFMIPAALSAAEPAGPAQLHQALPADGAGCAVSQDLVAQIFGKQPAAPAKPISPFAARQEKTWCGACLDENYCNDICYPCGGEVAACAPGCRPLCFCISC